MKLPVDVIVVIPIGPGSSIDFTADTIQSFIFYAGSPYKIVLADDSQEGIGSRLQEIFPEADVITTKKAMGGWAGLYITLSLAYRHAVEKYAFKVLLKLDTDALVIGEAPERDLIHFYQQNPAVGMAGQYRTDYDGKPWNIEWPRRRIINGTSTWKFFRRPFSNWMLRKVYKQALGHGYRAGENVFGGAYSMSAALLYKLEEAGLLPEHKLGKVNLGEDHLFSLLAKAVGFQLDSLAGNGMPFGCAWKGLPVSPQQLITDKRKIIHSVRYWQKLDEQQIRTYFSEKRKQHFSLMQKV